jgi:hypothetical protein
VIRDDVNLLCERERILVAVGERQAAVLSDALAVGLRTALDAVFVNRTRTARGS